MYTYTCENRLRWCVFLWRSSREKNKKNNNPITSLLTDSYRNVFWQNSVEQPNNLFKYTGTPTAVSILCGRHQIPIYNITVRRIIGPGSRRPCTRVLHNPPPAAPPDWHQSGQQSVWCNDRTLYNIIPPALLLSIDVFIHQYTILFIIIFVYAAQSRVPPINNILFLCICCVLCSVYSIKMSIINALDRGTLGYRDDRPVRW